MTADAPLRESVIERASLPARPVAAPAVDTQRLQVCYAVAESLVSNLRLDRLLQEVLDTLRRLFAYDRCVVARVVPDGTVAPWVGHPQGAETPFSRTIAGRVLARGEALLCDDVQGEAPFEIGESVVGLRIRSVLCAPLLWRQQPNGVLYLDRSVPGAYGPDDLALLVAVSRMMAVALENARLHDELRSRYERASEDLRRAERSLIEAERAAALGRLSLAIAHEVRNPVTVIGVLAGRLEKQIEDPEVDRALEVIREEGRRLERMVARVDALIALPAPQVTLAPLAATVEQALRVAEPMLRRLGARAEVRASGAGPDVPHDPGLTRTAVEAVLEQAAQAGTEGGTLTVEVGRLADGWVIEVGDARAAAASAQEMRSIYDPAAGEPWAVDLGLALAHRAMTLQGGDLRVGGRADTGTRVQLVLPFESRSPAG